MPVGYRRLIFVIWQCAAFLFANAVEHVVNTDSTRLKSIQLDELLVSTYRYHANIRQLAAPVQIIRSSNIERNEAGDLSATLNQIPGINMQSGTFQTTKFTIRGIGSRSPYSTNRTRAYLDNIPLTTGDGTTVMDDVELGYIEKIEITKGPHSAWYGSGMGGAVRFVTKQIPDNNQNIASQFSAGTYDFRKFTVYTHIPNASGYTNLGLTSLSGDGYRQNSNFKRKSGIVSGLFSNKGKLNYLLTFSDVHAQTPSSIDEETFRTSPSNAAPNWLSVAGYKAYERILAGICSALPINQQWKNLLTVSGSWYDQYELRPFNHLDDRAMSFSLQDNVVFNKNNMTISTGIEWLHENYFWRILANNDLSELQKATELRNQYNAFFGFEGRFHPSLTFSLAGNLNATTYSVHDLFETDEIDYSGNYFNKLIFSPKLGLNYRYSDQYSIYTSIGHGFSNPTVEESLDSEGFLNPYLKPEQGWTMDVGMRANNITNTLFADFSAYYILLHDLLVTKRLSESVFYGANAGTAILKGLELQLRYKPSELIQLTGAFNASENRFKTFISEDIDYAGKHLPGIPEMHAHVDMQTNLFRNWEFNAVYTFSGKQYLNDANTAQTGSWQTINLRSAYTIDLGKKIQVQCVVHVNNLLNEHYASMVLINAPSFGGRAPRYYYPGMPRNFLFTIRLGVK